MPKFLGVLGSIIGAMICITAIAVKQGYVPEASKLFGDFYDVTLMGGIVGIVAAVPLFFFHSLEEKLSLIKSCFFSVFGFGIVIFVFLIPSLLGRGVGWTMASDLMILVYSFGFCCGIGHYILYRIGYRLATRRRS